MPKQEELTVEQELDMLTNEVQRKLEDIKAIFTAFQERHPEEAKEISFYALSRLNGHIVESIQGTGFTLGLSGFSLAEYHKEQGTRANLDKVLKGYNAKLLVMSKLLEKSGAGSLMNDFMKDMKKNGTDS